ncbi:MAG: RHS repeat-associated core domain-containing protein [Myxococcales bacterium]|nr:RHS repeat-associated core domain-containing protein [Myxococcales bacterium]
MSKDAVLADAGDPLSATMLSESMTVNGTRTGSRAYDAATRTWVVTSPEGRASSYTLDSAGRVVNVTAPGQVPTEFVYDAEGYLLEVRREKGATARSTRYGYDSRGYLAAVTADVTPSDVLETLLPDNDEVGFAREVSVPGIGATTLQTPDVMGATTSLSPPGKPAHAMSYDAIGQMTRYAPPLADAPVGGNCPLGAECYGRNADRQLEDVKLGDGSVLDFTYGTTTGLLTSTVVPGALVSLPGTYGYTYTADGRLSTITAPDSGVITYLTQGDLPIKETWSGTHTVKDGATTVWMGALNGSVERTYSTFLEVSRVQVGSGGFDLTMTRDLDGLVTSIAPTTGTTVPTFAIGRSSLDGHVTGTTLGVVTTNMDVDVSASTPGYGDLSGMNAAASGADVFETSYLRDLLGRITEIHETVEGVAKTRKYTYDEGGRLVSVRDGSDTLVAEYGYDANGNRTLAHTPYETVDLGVNLGCAGMTTAADEEDRLCTYGEYEFVYDRRGALTSKTNTTTSATETYSYDGLGRLVKATVPGKTIYYVLDGQGRRIGKVVNGSLEKGWLYADALRPIAQLNSAGQVEATFVYGTRANVPDYIVKTDGTTYRVVSDNLGSVRLVINVADGTVVHRMDYDEWGRVTMESGTVGLHPFGFAGGMYDRDTKLVRFGARDYDAVTGRWTAKDPIRLDGGMNMLGYCGNDPVNASDPNGLQDPAPKPAAGGAAAGAAAAGGLIGAEAEAAGALACFGSGFCEAAAPFIAVGVIVWVVAACIDAATSDPPATDDARCAANYDNDVATCRAISKRRGPAAAARCYSSATARYAACLAGQSIPPLDTWNH